VGNSVVNWLNSNNIEVGVEYQEDGIRYRRVISGPNRHNDYIIDNDDPVAEAVLIRLGIIGATSPSTGGTQMTDAMIDSRSIVTEYEVVKEPPEQCSICMEEYRPGDSIRVLPCFHKYHKYCIDEWLRPHGDCPVCKFSII
jgi:hypothetical protein